MAKGGTPAILAAERSGIAFTVHAYQHDPEETAYGLEAARALNVAVERVFKTLVTRIDSTSFAVAVIPVAARLSLKALATALEGKKAELAQPADAERITGYIVGGISPLGQKRRLPTVLDASALQYETIFISAGRRGLDLELRAQDLVTLCQARTAHLML